MITATLKPKPLKKIQWPRWDSKPRPSVLHPSSYVLEAGCVGAFEGGDSLLDG